MPNPADNLQPFPARMPHLPPSDLNSNDELAAWTSPGSMMGNLGKLRKLDVRASQGFDRQGAPASHETPYLHVHEDEPINDFPVPYPTVGDGEHEDITKLLDRHHHQLLRSLDRSLDDWMNRHEASFSRLLEGSMQQFLRHTTNAAHSDLAVVRDDHLRPVSTVRSSANWNHSGSSVSERSQKSNASSRRGHMIKNGKYSAEKLVDEQLKVAKRGVQLNADMNKNFDADMDKNLNDASRNANLNADTVATVPHRAGRASVGTMGPRRKSEAFKVAERLSASTGMFKEDSMGSPAVNCCLARWARKVVKNSLFDACVTLAIFTNSAFIGVQVEVLASQTTNEPHLAILIVQWIYAVVFTVELAIRFVAEQVLFFCGENKGWNFLDSFIVVSTLFEVIMDVVVLTTSSGTQDRSSAGSVSSVRIIRILRLARLFRVIRVIRIARFIHALRTFVYSIIYTLRSLLWAMVLLFMITYIFAIMFTQAVGDYNVDKIKYPEKAVDVDDVLQRYWGSLPRSMYTLFKSISNGLSWDIVVHALGSLSPIWVVVFTCYIMFTYFAVLNVIVGVFCQSAIETAAMNEDLLVSAQMNARQMYMERIRKLFKDIDEDNSGMITITEFEEHLMDESVQAFFGSMDIETDDAWTLFQLLDPDGSHYIDLEEFVTGIFRLKGNAKRVDLVQMHGMLKRTWNLLIRLAHSLSGQPHAGLTRGMTGMNGLDIPLEELIAEGNARMNIAGKRTGQSVVSAFSHGGQNGPRSSMESSGIADHSQLAHGPESAKSSAEPMAWAASHQSM